MDSSMVSGHAAPAWLVWFVVLVFAGAALGTLMVPGDSRPTPPPTPLPTATAPGATTCPTVLPSAAPTTGPTGSATATATAEPTPPATIPPTAAPTSIPTVSPTAPPTQRPTPRPTLAPTPRPSSPPPTATPVPTPRPAAPSLLVRHGVRTSNAVALTFDMGGRVGDALDIVNWLVEHEIHATIFMTGQMADSINTDAGRRVLAIIDEHPELFTLGNHSYTHRDVRNLSAAAIADELRRTEEALARSCDQNPRPFFRPPNGGYDAEALAAIGAAGYRYTVTWDVDTIDWRPIVNDPPGPTADQIVAKVLANARGGSIVLMHLGGYETFDALPRIVEGLDARGYGLVSLDELL